MEALHLQMSAIEQGLSEFTSRKRSIEELLQALRAHLRGDNAGPECCCRSLLPEQQRHALIEEIEDLEKQQAAEARECVKQLDLLQADLYRSAVTIIRSSAIAKVESPDCSHEIAQLRSSLSQVKNALMVCVESLLPLLSQHHLIPRVDFMMPHYLYSARMTTLQGEARMSASDTKKAFEAFLCSLLFCNFEDPYLYAVPTTNLQPWIPHFERPQQRKQRFYDEYAMFRDEEVLHVVSASEEFVYFLEGFATSVAAGLARNLMSGGNFEDRLSFIYTHLLNNNSPFVTSLLQLAKAVWLLHKLVFSFHKLPQLLRVTYGSFFNDQYMECMEDGTTPDNVMNDLQVVQRVRYAGVPGFFVNDTIIRAQVWVFPVDHMIITPTGDSISA